MGKIGTIFFKVSDLKNIEVFKPRKVNIKWFEETSKPSKKFLGIRYGKTEIMPAGWGFSRYTDEELLYYYPEYDINKETREVYIKSKVIIRLNDGDYKCANFNYYVEALDYANELIEDSGGVFYPIEIN